MCQARRLPAGDRSIMRLIDSTAQEYTSDQLYKCEGCNPRPYDSNVGYSGQFLPDRELTISAVGANTELLLAFW